MVILILVLLLVAITLGISYYAYRKAFLAPKRIPVREYQLPQGEQYLPHHSQILKCVNEMKERSFEPITLTSYDGTKLYARYYHIADNAPLQIQFHGYKSCSFLDFCGGSKLADKLGHNALVVDQRSHGESEGRSITFGVKERRDCLCWIEYARKRFGENTEIILSGVSMGAATVLMATDLSLPSNVKGVIADCPFSSPKAIIQKVCKDIHLPPKIMYPFIVIGARIFAGFHLEESSALSAVSTNEIPILLIHGDADNFVPCKMSQEIYNACKNHGTFITIPDAGHALCYMVSTVQYEEAVTGFVQKILS